MGANTVETNSGNLGASLSDKQQAALDFLRAQQIELDRLAVHGAIGMSSSVIAEAGRIFLKLRGSK